MLQNHRLNLQIKFLSYIGNGLRHRAYDRGNNSIRLPNRILLIPVKVIEKAPSTDEELLQDFRQTGSQETLAKLYLRYADLVFGVCLKYLKERESAKDAVMNIYQELLQKLPLHDVGQFKGWLYTVAKNHCLMQLRRDKKMITIEFQPGIMQSEDFSHLDNMLRREQDFKKLEACLDRLPAEQKQSIRQFYLENKCYNEIAEQTGIEWNRVRSLIQNGRRNLKICMEKNG